MNTTEHATAKDFFKFLGVVIGAIFTILFFFLRMLGDSNNSEENSESLGIPEDDYNNLSSMSHKSTLNPMNANNIYDD